MADFDWLDPELKLAEKVTKRGLEGMLAIGFRVHDRHVYHPIHWLLHTQAEQACFVPSVGVEAMSYGFSPRTPHACALVLHWVTHLSPKPLYLPSPEVRSAGAERAVWAARVPGVEFPRGD